jgi:ribosome biogenesis GTPase
MNKLTETTGRVIGEEINKWIIQFSDRQLDVAKRKDNINLACGDWVILEGNEDLCPFQAFNQLGRLKNDQDQIIARNVDQMLIVTSINHEFNLPRLERYVNWAKSENVMPYILLSKIDITDEGDLNNKMLDLSQWFPGVMVIPFSILEERNLEKVNSIFMPGKTSVMIGSSGVGKSTLINFILKSQIQKTFEIGENDKGRHTTTSRKIFLTDNGHYIMDNPGIRSLSFEDAGIYSEEVCRFSNCTHINEPGCGILKKLREGTITELQYRQKMKLIREMQRFTVKDDILMEQEQTRVYRNKSKNSRAIQLLSKK